MSNKKNKIITEDEVLEVIRDTEDSYEDIDAKKVDNACFSRAKFACEKFALENPEDEYYGEMAIQLIQMAENLIYGF